MEKTKIIEYPFDPERILALRIGDMVNLSGTLYTGRDRLHKYLYDGGVSPISLNNAAIYHCGPIVLKVDGAWRVKAAGPTTSMREEPYMADIIMRHRVRLIIGKGGMGDQTSRACSECGCVYLQVTGGAAALLAGNIELVKGVHLLKEFGPAEAMWEFVVRNLNAVVAIDSRGRNLNKAVKTASRRVLRSLISN